MNMIVDYGLGNLDSVLRAFERAGIETKISQDPYEISKATSLILPGVGAFRDGIGALKEKGFIPYLQKHVDSGKNLLGICLGMQLLYEKSYENGSYSGLGFLKGSVKKLDIGLKVPHMGWNALKFHKEDPVLKYIKEDAYVYFVHSYYIKGLEEDVLAYSKYEKKIPAIVRKGNIYGMQFHPEKSGKVGESLIKAYGELIQ